MEGLPYNDQSLEENWAGGHLAQSHICHVHCFSVIIQLCFLPLGCSSQLPGLQTSIHHPRQGTTRCGTDSSSGLATALVTTQSSGSAFSLIFYRPVSRWVLQRASFTGITEAKSRKGSSASSSPGQKSITPSRCILPLGTGRTSTAHPQYCTKATLHFYL